MSILTQTKTEAVPAPSSSSRRIEYAVVESLCAAADIVIIVIAGVLGCVGYNQVLTDLVMAGSVDTYAGLGLITGLIYVISSYHLRLYRIQELFRDSRDYSRVLTSWAFAVLVLTVVLFVLKIGGSVSRGAVVCFAAIGGVLLMSWRRTAKRLLRRALEIGTVRGRRAIVLGDANELAPFGRRDLMARFGVDEVERITLPQHRGGRAGATLSAIDRAMQRARDASAGEIVLALPWANAAQLELVRNHLRLSPLPVRLLPDRAVSAVLAHEKTGPAQSLLIEIQRAPLSAAERVVKRALDIVIAGSALLLFVPLMILMAFAVKIESRGPIIFKQHRKGFNGKQFVIYKFRTMRVLENGPSIAQAIRGDRRITVVGRVLRQTSIDELPQLLNVIRGDMSIVGPRPHAVAHDDEYGRLITNYAFRHHVKPGMTGWAQVNGFRGETPRVEQMARRIELDLWYINNWSIGLDLRIMVRTCFELIRSRNAY